MPKSFRVAKTAPKSRGVFLTIMLAINALNAVFGLLSAIVPGTLDAVMGSVPLWYQAFVLIELVVLVVALVGIWFWKRWAAVLGLATPILSLVVAIVVIVSTGRNDIVETVAASIIQNVLWYWAIFRKWSLFT